MNIKSSSSSTPFFAMDQNEHKHAPGNYNDEDLSYRIIKKAALSNNASADGSFFIPADIPAFSSEIPSFKKEKK